MVNQLKAVRLVQRLLDPEDLGHAANPEIRDACREVLGYAPVETVRVKNPVLPHKQPTTTTIRDKLEALRRFIADDSQAATYQSLGQYRSALVLMIDSALLTDPFPSTATGAPQEYSSPLSPRDNGTPAAETEDERKAAEQEYTISAFAYEKNPVGSQEWCLFWKGWKARAFAEDKRDAEITRLKNLINTPEVNDFSKGLVLEAAHQRERWGTDHDGGKTAADWFWLIGYLAQKAMYSHLAGDINKALHHTITTAAACANWHAAIQGKTNMRPGIAPPGEQLAAPSVQNEQESGAA